jgi:hypothetical protein
LKTSSTTDTTSRYATGNLSCETDQLNPHYCQTLMSITALTRLRHWILSWASSIHLTHFFTSILFHLRPRLPSGLFIQVFQLKVGCIYHLPQSCYTSRPRFYHPRNRFQVLII